VRPDGGRVDPQQADVVEIADQTRPGVINKTSALQASSQAVAAGSICIQTPSSWQTLGRL
jgi:hypothetical protein